MRIAVVIPTKNRRGDLVRAVDSVLAQSTPPAEIIVVDQSASDESMLAARERLAARPDIPVVYLRRPDLGGLTAAKNTAVDNASSDALLFIDDDVILEPDFLEELARAYDATGLDGIGGVFLPDKLRGRWQQRFATLFRVGPFRDERLLLQYAGDRGAPHPTWLLSGGLSSCRSYVFRKFRFNEALRGASHMEDIDFYSRASTEFKFALAPRARAIHNVSQDVRLSLADAYTAKCQLYALYYARYVGKTRRNHLAYSWLRVGIAGDAFARAMRTGSLDPIKGVVRGFRIAGRGVREDQVLGAR